MRTRSLVPALVAFLVALPLAAAHAKMVINEIDYDQPGTDTAEFIELLNIGPGSVNLDDYTLELVNGNGGAAALYLTIDLPNVVVPVGGSYVVCGNTANVPGCDFDITPDENLVQNGPPDGIGLRRLGVLEDAVSYEGNTGAPYLEGTGTTAADDNVSVGLGISRTPDGQDTDNNNADFTLRAITPGQPTVPLGGAGLLALTSVLLAAGGSLFAGRSSKVIAARTQA